MQFAVSQAPALGVGVAAGRHVGARDVLRLLLLHDLVPEHVEQHLGWLRHKGLVRSSFIFKKKFNTKHKFKPVVSSCTYYYHNTRDLCDLLEVCGLPLVSCAYPQEEHDRRAVIVERLALHHRLQRGG